MDNLTKNNSDERIKLNRRKIIKRIVKKRNSDGSFIPVEVIKTTIERDGSKSVERLDPVEYHSRIMSRKGSNDTVLSQYESKELLNKRVNLTNQRDQQERSEGGVGAVFGQRSNSMDHPYANLEEQSRNNIARVAMAALN